MFNPSIEDVIHYQKSHNLIPISVKVWSDNLTPIRLFQQIKEEYSFLLESVEGGEKWARYSFIGNNPFLLFKVKDGQAYVQDFKSGEIEPRPLEGDPLDNLKQLLEKYKVPNHLSLPRFSGGAVGYIGYDAVTLMEDIPLHDISLLDQDQIRLMFCDEIIAFDHLQQEITFISHLHLNESTSEEELHLAYQSKCKYMSEKINHLMKKLKKDSFELFHLPSQRPDVEWDRVTSNFDKDDFIAAVDKVKEYIRAGDVFQTVLSQRFTMDINTDPFNVYRVLRTVNPSPYLYYLDLGDDVHIVGSSPERLVQVENNVVETNPIAGTRHRGKTEAEDEALAAELLADEKERAEHHMLLDLGRNDLGRIAEYGSVEVSRRMEIEKFSHVMHIVSTVKGKLRKDLSPLDSLLSCFPAGTVSGAPKIRAMEIIAELESVARNAYAGAIGYFSFTGNVDSCITIRTVMINNGKAHVQAGAGIVADSVPENEWMETRNKAKGMLIALQLAEQIFELNNKEESLYA